MIKLRCVKEKDYYRILSAQMLHKEDLPKKYLNGYPHCYQKPAKPPFSASIIIAFSEEYILDYDFGAAMHRETFEKIKAGIRASGYRLMKINRPINFTVKI